MKKLLWIVSILSILSGCNQDNIRPSGKTTTLKYDQLDFNGITVSNAFKITIIPGQTDSYAELEIDENLAPHTKVTVENGILMIGLEPNISVKGNPVMSGKVYAVNEITSLNISGASKISVSDSLISENLKLAISGASELEALLNVRNLTASLDGASKVSFTGEAKDLNYELSGASTAQGYDLITRSSILDLSGASSCKVYVTDSLSVVASGASSVKYKGSPVIFRSDISGASSLDNAN